jgi:hypothetical protein
MVIELGGSVFEITHDLVGDLFRAKNAGVTLISHRNLTCEMSLTYDPTWHSIDARKLSCFASPGKHLHTN